MATNLELKARIRSVAEAEAAALRSGASFSTTLRQVDTYYVVPHGRLKLREFENSGAEIIFYNRAEDRAERWSTYEKIPCPDPEALKIILEKALGIRAVVQKTRLLYQYRQCRIHIDTVEGLGTFLEFEVQDSNEKESADLMKKMRETFQISPGDVLQASYSDMVFGKNGPF